MSLTTPAPMTVPTTLDALVRDLDLAARPGRPMRHTVGAVTSALAPYLGQADLLTPEQRIGDPNRDRQHLLHVPPDGAYSLLAIVWLPGQTTPIHDHITWCVVGVHEGEEYETARPALPRAGPARRRDHRSRRGHVGPHRQADHRSRRGRDQGRRRGRRHRHRDLLHGGDGRLTSRCI
jgi:hypothetical protein